MLSVCVCVCAKALSPSLKIAVSVHYTADDGKEDAQDAGVV